MISNIDIAIIGIYLVVILAIGIWVARTTETGDDLFLAGRSLTWGFIGFSLFASNISSTTLVGVAGAAYSTGISVSNYEWMAGVILIFMAFFYIPVYIQSRITTIPEYLERRFNRASRKYFSAITIFLSIIVDTAGGLYAGAVVLQVFFPDLVIWQVCVAIAVFAGLYTAAGGLAAVVYTDTIQAIILILGTILISYFVFARFDFSWAMATSQIPEGNLSLIRPMDDPALPWLGTLVGVPILGFWYWATNQYITQRILGAKNVEHARWGAVFGGLLKLLPLFTMAIPAAMAVTIFPDLPNPDQVFPMLVTEVLPVGVIGLVLAGLISAIMSSVDSTLNSASTLVVNDFIMPTRPDLTGKQVANYGRVTTLVFMVLAVIWAPMIANFGGLFAYLQQAFSILVPPVAAVFLLGMFWRRGTGGAAFQTLVIGHAVGVVVFYLSLQGIWDLHFTINVGIMTLLSAVLFVVLSLTQAPPDPAQVAEFTWSPEQSKPVEALPVWKDYRYQSLAVLVLTVIMLLMFW